MDNKFNDDDVYDSSSSSSSSSSSNNNNNNNNKCIHSVHFLISLYISVPHPSRSESRLYNH